MRASRSGTVRRTAVQAEGHPGGEARSNAPRVLFVYPFDATFIRTDLEILERFCSVTRVRADTLASLVDLVRRIPKADIIFSWFAERHSAVSNLVARGLGKGTILVAGGWDVSRFPEIGYGRLLTRWGRIVARVAIGLADRVLPFSDSSTAAVRDIAPSARVTRVYLGVDPARFTPSGKEPLVVCVAQVTHENLTRKGLRTFVRASRLLPDVPFILVGQHRDDSISDLRRLAGENISFPGWLPEHDLRQLLGRAQVYVQPSYTEGFGLALVEAMASGCVPVVTEAGSMPEVVGPCGILVRYGDIEDLVRAIRVALGSRRGIEARHRVEASFSIERRTVELRQVVDELWHARSSALRSLSTRMTLERGANGP